MSKIVIFLSIFVPFLFILIGFYMAGAAVRSLIASSQTLECFCPSCGEMAFPNKGAQSLGLIRVDIAGAVKKPGIYQLEIGQRVADLLASASGFTKDADQAYVARTLNLATELKNQDKIYIPFLSESEISSKSSDVMPSLSSTSDSTLISVNQASSAQLQVLSGIGEVKSKSIIDNRPYSSLEELVSKGILSESLLADLKAQISL